MAFARSQGSSTSPVRRTQTWRWVSSTTVCGKAPCGLPKRARRPRGSLGPLKAINGGASADSTAAGAERTSAGRCSATVITRTLPSRAKAASKGISCTQGGQSARQKLTTVGAGGSFDKRTNCRPSDNSKSTVAAGLLSAWTEAWTSSPTTSARLAFKVQISGSVTGRI